MCARIDNRRLSYNKHNMTTHVYVSAERPGLMMRKRKTAVPAELLALLENQAVRRPSKRMSGSGSDEQHRKAVGVCPKPPPKAAARSKSAERILNEETGNVQPMLPLMNRDTEFCTAKAGGKTVEEEKKDGDKEEASGCDSASSGVLMKRTKKPESSQQSPRFGQIIKQVTYFDTWYVIQPMSPHPAEKHQQRQQLELPLVKLANAAVHMKMPSEHWNSKVTLYEVAPTVLQRHTMTVYTGDLKVHKIPERERHKYQPSCVIFRRELPSAERGKCLMPYDRAIIFKQKQFTVNLDGKLVVLMGAPDTINSVQDVIKLIDILEHITLNHAMVEIVSPK